MKIKPLFTLALFSFLISFSNVQAAPMITGEITQIAEFMLPGDPPKGNENLKVGETTRGTVEVKSGVVYAETSQGKRFKMVGNVPQSLHTGSVVDFKVLSLGGGNVGVGEVTVIIL